MFIRTRLAPHIAIALRKNQRGETWGMSVETFEPSFLKDGTTIEGVEGVDGTYPKK